MGGTQLTVELVDPVLGYSLSPPLILQPPRDPSLENHLSTEPNVAKTLTNLISVARALAFLHANGISHGALTPNSILIPPNAPSRITGFGLCPLQNPASRHEQPRFVAPELLSGEPPQPASDSYALAMVLHQVLARHPPFEGLKPAEVIYQVLVEEERPERPEGLSNGLWEIVEGGWKQEPAKRLSLAEMGARLEDIVKTM